MMEWTEILGGTLNIALLACFYTAFGAFISYILFHLFDDYGKEWESQGTLYQTADIATELSLVGVIAFWITYIIREFPPMFPVHRALDRQVDTYVSGLFFAYAMFLFLGDLTNKVKFIYEKFLKSHFVRMFPPTWSVTKCAFARKTNEKKDSDKEHYTNGL
jgi:hypothetical protein